MLKFRRITYKDVDLINNMSLRKADIEELKTATGFKNPIDSLRYSVAHSTEWTEVCQETDTGEIITIFGLGKTLDHFDEPVGVPWMVASPSLIRYRKVLMRYSRKVVQEMLEQFPLLNNFVDSRNTVHIHWLKHMGFQFAGKDLIIRGIPFKYFFKRRED